MFLDFFRSQCSSGLYEVYTDYNCSFAVSHVETEKGVG